MRSSLALGCLAVIAGADHLIRRHTPPWIVVGMLDHPAHLATAELVLGNLRPRTRAWRTGYRVGALLPDLDHMPLALRAVHPAPGDPRPVTHGLIATVPPAAYALATRSERAAGAAAGMLAHFARDLGVGTGAPLLWPATARQVRVPYWLYAIACVLLARRATLVGGL